MISSIDQGYELVVPCLVQDVCFCQRGLCQGLPQGVNTGSANRLTFGKGTQLIIRPCKCFCRGDGSLSGK